MKALWRSAPRAAKRNGGECPVPLMRRVFPTQRMALVGTTRWPLTARASAPAPHSPLATACTSWEWMTRSLRFPDGDCRSDEASRVTTPPGPLEAGDLAAQVVGGEAQLGRAALFDADERGQPFPLRRPDGDLPGQ